MTIAVIKKRFGAQWVQVSDHGPHHYLIRVVHPDEFGIHQTGDHEVVRKSEWEGWG